MPSSYDKVVAITGASAGIGEATARLLAERGATVVLGARRTARLDELAESIRQAGGTALTCKVDVTNREDLQQFVAAAVEEYGRLDVMVNNAGVSKLGPMTQIDIDAWDAMIDVNLRGVLHGIAAALPAFRRQGQGHFVTTVSTAGLGYAPTMAVYAGTKNAVRAILETLRKESTDGVIRQTQISPGYVRTELDVGIDDPDIRKEIRRGMDEFGLSPDAIARAIAFAIEQPHDVEIGEMSIRPTVQG
ncbi:SDR family oxidoreductase [Streptomyces fuscichromogenes]|uniref:Oxidoreductase n=1 Tax=Streptomyces fuscichromogenes TaxID=1324013 RepID=A0A917XPB2_9ACTN|nr:SDR family oxidoreductase [Streptomyces fuscichromogenes]GGN44913.1 oxidoreductase [Streptomyces fuscichromogenes]